MSSGAQVARNAAWLMIATTAQKAVSFLSFTFVARVVGPETTGLFFFAVSITSIFVTFTDLGLTPVLIREMASDEASGRRFLAKAIRLKLLLIPAAVLGVLGYSWLTGITGITLLAVLLACFVMSADAVSLIWYGAIRGKRLLRYEAIGMFFGQVFTAIVSVSAAVFGWGVIGLVFGLLAGSAWNVGWSILHARKLGITLLSSEAWPVRRIAKLALPFALAGIFVKIYSYVDTLLLKAFHDAVIVGHYAVAYKVTYALQFLPLAFVAALYPSMSAASAAKKSEDLRELLKGSMRLMMFASVPLAALLSALAEPIVLVVYGESYHGSIVPLSILPWVLIPIFLDFPIGSLLNATHRAGLKTAAMGVAMVVNVAANFMLVPVYGAEGAAWSGVASFTILLLVGLFFIRHDVKKEWRWLAGFLLRGVLAAALIWIPVRFALPRMQWIVLFAASPVYALAIMYVFGLFKAEDVKELLLWLRKRAQPPEKTEEELHERP